MFIVKDGNHVVAGTNLFQELLAVLFDLFVLQDVFDLVLNLGKRNGTSIVAFLDDDQMKACFPSMTGESSPTGRENKASSMASS